MILFITRDKINIILPDMEEDLKVERFKGLIS